MSLLRACSTIVLLSILAVISAGCDDSPASPSENPALVRVDLRLGTGTDAVSGKLLTVHYTGWLHNPAQTDQKGAQFDSSIGLTPFQFVLGAGEVIGGWDVGVVGMKVGGFRRLTVPPSLGYGSARNGPIPPNATLVFEIELLDVQ